jgi:predicted metal-dependent RNase
MKINLRTLFFFLFFFPLVYLQAAHVIGGELTYVFLGNGDYQITIATAKEMEQDTMVQGMGECLFIMEVI